MHRGDVHWVDFPEPMRRRPAVLVTRNEAYAVRTRATVVPITRTVRGIPTEVRLGASDGMPKACVANADDIMTIPRNLIQDRITGLSPTKAAELDTAIRFALALG